MQSESNHTNSLVLSQEVMSTFDSASTILNTQSDFSGLSMSTISQAGSLSKEFATGPTYYNPFGGTFTLSPSTSGVVSNDLASITVTNIPNQACSDTINQIAPQLYSVFVNGKLVALTPPATPYLPGRTSTDFSKNMSLCTNSDNNTIVFNLLKPFNLGSVQASGTQILTISPQASLIMADRSSALALREAAQVAIP